MNYSPSRKKVQYLPYINQFRGMAMLFIVAVHLYKSVKRVNPDIYQILEVILGNGSVLFVFISGFLFQHLLPKYKMEVYLKKKFLYVLVPYFIMSLPPLILYFFNLPYAQNYASIDNFNELPFYSKLMFFMITGSHLARFWFIPMIALFYLLSPIFTKIDETPKLYLIIPFLLIIAFLLGRHHYRPFISIFYFLPVYILGMGISRYKNFLFKLNENRVAVFMLMSVFFFSYLTVQLNEYDFLYFQKIALSVFFIILFKKYSHGEGPRFFNLVAEYSFSIYFLHIYVNILLTHLLAKFNVLSVFYDLAGFIIRAFVVLLLSILLSLLIRKIFKDKSRIITGS